MPRKLTGLLIIFAMGLCSIPSVLGATEEYFPLRGSSGEILLELGRINAATFTPDGRYCLIAVNGRLDFWNLEETEPNLEYYRSVNNFDHVSSMLSLNRGKWLLYSDSPYITLYDVESQKRIYKKPFANNPSGVVVGNIQKFILSPDEKTVLAVSHSVVSLLDVETGALLNTRIVPFPDYADGGFSASGKEIVVSAYMDSERNRLVSIDYYNVETQEKTRSIDLKSLGLKELDGAFFVREISQDGRLLLTYDGQVWDLETSRLLWTADYRDHFVWDAVFSPDGSEVISSTEGEYSGIPMFNGLRVWNSRTGEIKQNISADPLSFHQHYNFDLIACYQSGDYFLTKDEVRGTIFLWSRKQAKTVHVYSEYAGGSTNDAVFSPDGERVLLADSRFFLSTLWDSQKGIPVGSFSGHTDRVHAVAYTPDGKYVLSGSDDKTVRVWDANTDQLVQPWSMNSEVLDIALSPDGQWAAVACRNHTVSIRSVPEGEILLTFGEHSRAVNSVDVSNDGRWIVSGSGVEEQKTSGEVLLWDANSGEILRRWDFLEGEGYVSSVDLSSDGTQVIAGVGENAVYMWSAQSGEVLRKNQEGNNDRQYVRFAPDGRRFATSFNGRTRLQDTETGTVVWTAPIYGVVAFSPDGKSLLIDHTIWDVAAFTAVQHWLLH